MAAWILGGCGANYGAPAFYQCQPTDPYANVEIPDLLTSITVPRIKFVVCPDERKRRNVSTHAQTRDSVASINIFLSVYLVNMEMNLLWMMRGARQAVPHDGEKALVYFMTKAKVLKTI
eukprot:Gregarina_sp_Poly_1__3472@NODE_2008_length_2870_cov_130_666429_g858_i1_p3_GENE_NODE_2008_length_2870_cov_130_666429_g858_i1NODE_2008_length_2870_cov_130_666429_g858_i1_p3_ORF_typecomplete_len119_score9_42_NODE_2008_length_2870_cov_130_666429_g858_i131387